MQMGSFKTTGIVFTVLIGTVFGTECSNQNRTSNLDGCFEKIKEIMNSPNKFWFGSDYKQNCPQGPGGGLLCSNPLPGKGLSIASRILPGGYDESLLTKFLAVRFTSNPGDYTGCGNTFTSTGTLMYDIDPTSSQILRPWDLRHTPEMTWDAEDGEYYSIYVYDVGSLVTHAVYINIQGRNNDTIHAYQGPRIAVDLNNPYIFMLFKQNGFLDPKLAMDWYNTSHTGMASQSHIPEFISQLKMIGPVAVNWIVATGDEFGAGMAYSLGEIVTCPIFIGKALDMKPRPFLPSQSVLTVIVNVPFESAKVNFDVCCESFVIEPKDFTLNPIGDELIDSVYTRSFTEKSITMEKLGYFEDRNNFTDDVYTMITLDPDVPSNSGVGNESHPYIYQIQINIRDGNFTSGEEVLGWFGPYPTSGKPQYCFILLYKQGALANREQILSYASKNCSNNRCLFDINAAITDNGFDLVGANWFRSVPDVYMLYRDINTGRRTSEDTVCAGRPDYPESCNPNGKTVICYSSFNIGLALLLIALFNNFMHK